jgi:hypothetical protein
MDGSVLNFDVESDAGIIRASDGKRYRFRSKDWSSAGAPEAGDIVDFEPVDGEATEIFVTSRVAVATTMVTPRAEPPPADAPPASNDQPAPVPQTPPVVQTFTAPSGKGAKFFIAYFLAMVPTYILPYFGSNSMVIGGISAGAGGGLPPLYIWHITFFAVLVSLAFVRGIRIQRGWLITFPIVAGFFDLVAGFNWIPFIPTVMHFAALYVGASKDAVPGFDRDSVLPRAKWAYALLALVSFWATYQCMTSPWAPRGSAIAYGLVPLIIFAISGFIALRVHKGFGDSLGDIFANLQDTEPASSTAVGDGDPILPQAGGAQTPETVAAENSPTEEYVTPGSDWKKPGMPQMIAGALIIGLLALGSFFLFAKPKAEFDPCLAADAANQAECATAVAIAAEPAITGQTTSMFIVADANVRDRATAQGSRIIDKMFRGNSVSGVMQFGEDGQSRWLKLDGSRGFIGAVNLSTVAPPTLAKSYQDLKWDIEEETVLLASPTAGSREVARLYLNDQTTIAGVTENGYAEVKRKKGGVGYFLITSTNDRMDVLSQYEAADAAEAVAAAVADVSDISLFEAKIGGENVTLELDQRTNQFVRVFYGNGPRATRCSAHLSQKQNTAAGILYSQRLEKSDKPCAHRFDVEIAFFPKGIYAKWIRQSGQIYMEGNLRST